MIKKFLNKILGKAAQTGASKKPSFGQRQEVDASVHGISPDGVDERARDVVLKLQSAGFAAYIVGGAVRDLMIGLRPKDFDVATDATPEQVKALFRRAFIVGRRFRIVHVVYGRGREHEVIEVSTFRAQVAQALSETVSGNEHTSALASMQHAVGTSGRVLRDNVWGTQQEDAARRDFTLNALYYDPQTQMVVDYHGGISDVQARIIRMIGEPALRYREDPVRLIRAVRFAAKLSALGFVLDAQTALPLVKSQKLLADVPQSRLFDEMLKLLQTGHAQASISQLKALHLDGGTYPLLDLVAARAAQPLVDKALEDTDQRVAAGKSVVPSFLLACVLWADVRDGWAKRVQQRQPNHMALQEAIDDVFGARIGDVSGRGKLAADMREIWLMQPRFDKRVGRAPFGLVEQPRFRAAFDFLRLRADVAEVDPALPDWWQAFSQADDTLRQDMVEQVRIEQQQRRPRPTRARKTPAAPTAAASDRPPNAEPDAATAQSPPPKRRRRSRSGASAKAVPDASDA